MSGNEEQIEYWNGKAGETWVTAQERVDAMLAPLSAQAVAAAAVQAGERVVDIGCGCGATSIAFAERGAHVWGVDISAPMLARARERSAGLDNVAFSEGDAATQSYTPDHQLVFSRFGVMFFADPHAAFANIRSALVPGGRLVFMCWQAPRENPWMAVAGRAIQPYLPEPEAPVDPQAPGPFAFARDAYIRDILGAAGFSDVEIVDTRAELHIGDTLDDAMAAQSEIGPAARALAELDGDERDAALAAAREALAPHISDNGINLGAAAWIVSARA